MDPLHLSIDIRYHTKRYDSILSFVVYILHTELRGSTYDVTSANLVDASTS